MRKIAIHCGSRADASPLSPLIRELGDNAIIFETEGMYAHELACKAFFDKHKPDLLVLLGDRYETLAIASYAALRCIPIAHIHGGDYTPYAVDEQFRNAITKLAYWHFPACQLHAERIHKMGEPWKRIFVCGAPGVDLLAGPVMTREECEKELRTLLEPPIALVCYHPETLGQDDMSWTEDLKHYGTVIISGSNADIGGKEINEYWQKHHTCYYYRDSFSQKLWLSLMHHTDALIGNSSGFVFEGLTLGKRVIMIGNRQRGRYEDVLALFKQDWQEMYPFGKPGEVSKKIAERLLMLEIPDKPRKLAYAN